MANDNLYGIVETVDDVLVGTLSTSFVNVAEVLSVNGKTGVVVLDAEDVGALPDDTEIPTKTSDLTNDSGFITKTVNDLENYYTETETDTLLSGKAAVGASYTKTESDAKYITEHQSLAAYRTSAAQDVIDAEIIDDIPTKTSDLTNDSGFITGVSWSEVSNKPSTFPPSAHDQAWSTITGKPSTYPPSSHNHDDRYYTETEVDTALAGKAAVGASYTKSESDAKYLTEHQDISGKANVGDSYTKAQSDAKYLTEHQSLAAYRTSANQDTIDTGLQDQITALKAIGKFLAIWNSSTGLPETDPPTLPYTYHTGDYYRVGTVSTGGTNYKPNGSSYNHVASTTVETEDVDTGWVYYYDGTNWKAQSAGSVVDWDEITNKPSTFTPSAHTQGWDTIANKPSTYPPSAHTHDDRYYTEAEVNAAFITGENSTAGTPIPVNADTLDGHDSTYFVPAVTGKGLSTNDYDDIEKGLVASALQASALTPYRTATAEDVINATKADKTALDKTDRSLDMLWKLNKGQTWDFDVDTDTLYTKTVPSGAKYDSVDMVGGKSVVMNQLVPQFAQGSVTQSGITRVVNGDGTVTFSGTSTVSQDINIGGAISNTQGHKYFLMGNSNQNPSLGTFFFTSQAQADYTGNGAIWTSDTSSATRWYVVHVANGVTMDGVVFRPQVVDLTQWFGSGNEPSTTTDAKMEQVKTWLAANPSYNTGEIKSASVDSIIVKDNDEVTASTFNVPSAIQNLTGYGWSAGSVYNEVNYASKKYIQRVGRVDMGTLDWSFSSGTQNMYASCSYLAEPIKSQTNPNIISNIICHKYVSDTAVHSYDKTADKIVAYINNSDYGGNMLRVYDSAYTDPADFKTAINGVYLYYELATPIETDISALLTDGFMENFDVESGGTITYHNSNGDGYKLPVPATNEFIVKIDEVS